MFCTLLNLLHCFSTSISVPHPAENTASASAVAASSSVQSSTHQYQAHNHKDCRQHQKWITRRVRKIQEALKDDSLRDDFDREIRKLPLPTFLPRFHPTVSFTMRAKAISWLGDVADDLGLSYNSYFLAVHIFDRYLRKRATLNKPILSKDLQAIGIASLQIAGSMNDERSAFLVRIDKPQPPPAKPQTIDVKAFSNELCANVTDYTYNPQKIGEIARDIMATLKYELILNPTVDFWVCYYLKRLGFSPENEPVTFPLIFNTAMHILSLAVLDADSRAFAPCELAFATIQCMFPDAPILAPIDPECLSFMRYHSNIMLKIPIPPERESVLSSTLYSVAADFAEAQDWTWFRHLPFYRTYAESYERNSAVGNTP